MATGELKRIAFLDTGVLNIDGHAGDTVEGGPALNMDLVKDGTLSATVDLLAETNTITMEAYWEGSNVAGGAGVYYRLPATNNAANVVWATGTAGADAHVIQILPAPASAYGCLYTRVSVVNRVAAGNAVDTYQIGYNFIQSPKAKA